MKLDPATLAELTAQVRRELMVELRRSRLAPAKVASVGMRDDGLPSIQVIVEGDAASNPTEITPITPVNPTSLAVGDPVMVRFDPPAGVYLVGLRGNVAASNAGGRPYATRVIAAADSIATGAANADYVCSGSGDADTLQEACDAADSEDGRVLLLEGTYNLAGGTLTVPGTVQLAGMGLGTVLNYASGTGALVTLATGAQIQDVLITRGSTNEASISCSAGGGQQILRCSFTGGGGSTAHIVSALSSPNIVTDCRSTGDGGLYEGYAPRLMSSCAAVSFSLGWGFDFSASPGPCTVTNLLAAASNGASGGMQVQSSCDELTATGITLTSAANAVPALEWNGDEGFFQGSCYRAASFYGSRNRVDIRVKGPSGAHPLLWIDGEDNAVTCLVDGEETCA